MGIGVVDYPANNGCLVKLGDEEWEDRSSQNVACIEGVVVGDNFPKVNMALLNIDFPEVFVIEKQFAEFKFTVQNKATDVVTGFDVEGFVDGETVGTVHFDCEMPSNSVETFSASMPLGVTEVVGEPSEFTLKITEVEEGDDEDMLDNELSVSFDTMLHDFARRILVEEFTSEKCPSCPSVGEYIGEALEKEEFKDVIVVCHHSGYQNDWLTTPFDNDYTWFYNGGTYAPAMMVDRGHHSNGSATWLPTSLEDMEDAWRKSMEKPAFVLLNISAKWNEGNPMVLDIDVSGEKSAPELCHNPYITIWLVEDNIEAVSQSSAPEWTHQHTNRAVNNTWGEPVVFDGDDYSYSCSMQVASSWKIEDMKIVVFIANYNGDDPLDCEVMNAASIQCPSSPAGIEYVEDSQAEDEYYNLQGMKIKKHSNGIYLHKIGTKTEKVIIR